MILLSNVFSDESLALLKSTIQSKEAGNVLDRITKEAYIDIIECIEKESLKTDDDLEDYIETHYAELNEQVYFAVCELLAFVDGEYDATDNKLDNMKVFIVELLSSDEESDD